MFPCSVAADIDNGLSRYAKSNGNLLKGQGHCTDCHDGGIIELASVCAVPHAVGAVFSPGLPSEMFWIDASQMTVSAGMGGIHAVGRLAVNCLTNEPADDTRFSFEGHGCIALGGPGREGPDQTVVPDISDRKPQKGLMRSTVAARRVARKRVAVPAPAHKMRLTQATIGDVPVAAMNRAR